MKQKKNNLIKKNIKVQHDLSDSLCFSGDTIFFLIQKLILFLLQNIFLFLDCFNELIL
jgi:hypothetical protein